MKGKISREYFINIGSKIKKKIEQSCNVCISFWDFSLEEKRTMLQDILDLNSAFSHRRKN